MKSFTATFKRIFSALEFANIEGLHGLQEMLDRHESRAAPKAPSPFGVGNNRETGSDNVYYLSPAAPAK